MASLAHCMNEVNMIKQQASHPIDLKEHDLLVAQLDKVKSELERLEKQSKAGYFLQNIKEQIIYLYGKIDDCFISYELKTIENEALFIQDSLIHGNLKAAASTLGLLKDHIDSLWAHYCPSLAERRVLTFAEEQLEQAHAILGSPSAKSKRTKEQALSLKEREETEMALEMIADALSQNDEKRAAFFFNRLNKAQQKLLCSYLPKEERTSFLHEVEGAADHNKIFLRKR